MDTKLSTPRSQWIRALSLVDKADLIERVQRLAANWTIKPKSQPQAGLGVLKLKESTLSESFFLGEFPLACVWVEVTTEAGLVAEGAANVMHDDLGYAEALALCDAILANDLEGWQEVATLLQAGVESIAQKDQARKKILASTRVDFSLLEDASDADQSENSVSSPLKGEPSHVTS